MPSDDRSPAIADIVQTAIDEVLATRGGGFVTGLVGCAQIVDENGEHGLIIFTPGTQAITTTLGMTEFISEEAHLDARSALLSVRCDDDDD